MQDAWHLVKWVCAAVMLTFLVVQVVAAWRLDSGGKKRARTILWVIVVLTTVQTFLRDVFGNREVGRIGTVIVAMVALIGTMALLRMLRMQPLRGTTGIKSGSENSVQTLKLS